MAETPHDSRLIGSIEDRVRRLEMLHGLTPSGAPAMCSPGDAERINEAILFERRTGRLFPECEVRPTPTALPPRVRVVPCAEAK